MRVTVQVVRREEISDPEGATIARALHDLGYDQVRNVRADKTFHMEIEGDDPERIRTAVADMCERLLANPVLEDYTIEVNT